VESHELKSAQSVEILVRHLCALKLSGKEHQIKSLVVRDNHRTIEELCKIVSYLEKRRCPSKICGAQPVDFSGSDVSFGVD
jgi:hypothetical protein